MATYTFLDVIRERSTQQHAFRWQVLAVEPEHYVVRSLFSAPGQISYGRWLHAEAEAFTELEWSPVTKQPIGVTCPLGHTRRTEDACDCKPKTEEPTP
jgi:hypothetical protein